MIEPTLLVKFASITFLFGAIYFTIGQIFKKFNKSKNKPYSYYINLSKSFSKFLIFLLYILTIGQIFGININHIISSLGLLTLGLGLALKDLVNNIVSGLIVMIYEPFKIGDIIEVDGVKGAVHKIDIRYTTVQQDNITAMIPNSVIMSLKIKKFTFEKS